MKKSILLVCILFVKVSFASDFEVRCESETLSTGEKMQVGKIYKIENNDTRANAFGFAIVISIRNYSSSNTLSGPTYTRKKHLTTISHDPVYAFDDEIMRRAELCALNSEYVPSTITCNEDRDMTSCYCKDKLDCQALRSFCAPLMESGFSISCNY